MPRKMSDKGVAALKPRATRYAKPDPELRGHWIRIQPSGAYWHGNWRPNGQLRRGSGPYDLATGTARVICSTRSSCKRCC